MSAGDEGAPVPTIRDLLLFLAREIPRNTRRVAILESALSIASAMLEGTLDPDPVVSDLARRLYRARLLFAVSRWQEAKARDADAFAPTLDELADLDAAARAIEDGRETP